MIKEIKGYEMTNDDVLVVTKSFSGATVECMEHYVKPTLKKKQDVMIIHCGTNNIRSTDVDTLADNIINLAIKCADSTNVIISSLVQRNDSYNEKVKNVNTKLKQICHDMNIGFIDNSNIDPKAHLNRSKLHLNRRGARILEKNLQLACKN